MRGAWLLLLAAIACALSCNGTTGYQLVQFYAGARGFAGAVKGKAYTFDAPGGTKVTLTQATLHIGALYLTQSIPQPGGGPVSCEPEQTYEGAFVGQVRGERDVDLLDPSLQQLEVVGQGSTIAAATGEVWLVHDQALTDGNLNGSDPLPILTLVGSYEHGGATTTFAGAITIDTNRITATNAYLPSADQICNSRIVSGIPAQLTVAQGGTLALRVDAAALFAGVPFTDLPTATTLATNASSACLPDVASQQCFTNDASNVSSIKLFENLTGRGPYELAWLASALSAPSAPPGSSGCISVAAGRGTTGFSLKPAPCVDPSGLGPGQLLLTASGEAFAAQGYTFPDPNGTFADGWAISFTHYIATFDKVSLWSNPDKVPTDQSQHDGLVAELDGPWAVDMHLNGASFPYVDGKEMGERAVAFAVMTNENRNGGAAFPTDGTRLAVGFSAVEPTSAALNVNLDADGLDAYKYMIDNQCTVYYRGTARWVGNTNGGKCATPSDAGVASGAGDGTGNEAEFANIPTTVNFDFCFKPADLGNLKPGDPETSFINCDNQDNDPARGVPGEPHQRGIAFPSNKYVVGEVTFHTDHPFWESTEHDTPARFDPFAAQVAGVSTDGGVPTVHFEDTRGVDYLGFTDKQGNPLPWRTCDPNYQNPNGQSRVGQMHFDPVKLPGCTNGDRATGLCDYYDFSKYDQSTQGHWNGADGLCFVQRHYASPP